MKFYSKKIVVLVLIGFIHISGCKKLDESPKSFVTPENFYTTSLQIEATFAAAMNALWNAWSGYAYEMPVFNNDDQMAGGELIIPTNWGNNLWGAHYNAILNLNSAIRAMKRGSLEGVTPANADILMAQARCLRAYNYFMLVRMFGALPLLTEDIEDPFNAKIGRTGIKEIYDLIVSDFSFAIAKLPSTWPSAQRGRPTKGVVQGLLAKTYLTMACYPLNDPSYFKQAAELSGQIIADKIYDLEPDISKLFTSNAKYGKEMMFSFNSNYADMATDPHIWSSLEGWSYVTVDPEWEQKYPEGPRKVAYLQTDLNGVHYRKIGKNPGVKKFIYESRADYLAGRSVINMPIIRFADILLIYAESTNMANGGPTQAGVDALNRVIDRANGYVDMPAHPKATINLSMADFDAMVLDERSLELCFEYDRWFDLIRKHILKEKSAAYIRQNFSDEDYLFPIPENDIRLNPLLKQNPGYK